MVEVFTCVSVASSSLKWKISTGIHTNNRTHAKDLRDLAKVRLPGRDRLFLTLCVKASRDYISITPLDQLPLNICHGPAIKSILVDGSTCMSLVQFTMSIDLLQRARID